MWVPSTGRPRDRVNRGGTRGDHGDGFHRPGAGHGTAAACGREPSYPHDCAVERSVHVVNGGKLDEAIKETAVVQLLSGRGKWEQGARDGCPCVRLDKAASVMPPKMPAQSQRHPTSLLPREDVGAPTCADRRRPGLKRYEPL